jgi:hypothetical protein
METPLENKKPLETITGASGKTPQTPTIVFEPTNGMKKWLHTAIELGYGASISDVAKNADLDRANWYDWLDKPGFVEWWDTQWQKYFAMNRWKLKAIGLKQAERNYDYWRDMMVSSGQLQDQPAVQNNTQINLNKYLEDV